jgi:hypothetical protein
MAKRDTHPKKEPYPTVPRCPCKWLKTALHCANLRFQVQQRSSKSRLGSHVERCNVLCDLNDLMGKRVVASWGRDAELEVCRDQFWRHLACHPKNGQYSSGMSSAQNQHTFSCDFGDGAGATARIDVDALRSGKGKTQYLFIEWTGKPGPAHLPKYRAWMMTVQQRAAELLPGRILWAVQTGPNVCEFYALEPGMPPKRLQSPEA